MVRRMSVNQIVGGSIAKATMSAASVAPQENAGVAL